MPEDGATLPSNILTSLSLFLKGLQSTELGLFQSLTEGVYGVGNN